MKQIDARKAVICVIASQIANLGESIIGAALQDKEGFRWVGNHFVGGLVFDISVRLWYFFAFCFLILSNWRWRSVYWVDHCISRVLVMGEEGTLN